MRGLLVAVALPCVAACKKSEPKVEPKVATVAAAPAKYECTWQSEQHPWREPGFAWPDATFALTISPEEQAQLRTGENEDLLAMRDRLFFVRAWAPVPVNGLYDFGIGYWVEVSRTTFDELKLRKHIDVTQATGRIANQSPYLAPTLGMRVRLEPRGPGLRPAIRFLDEQHPLAQAQKNGIPLDTVRAWLSEGAHLGEDAPSSAPFKGALDVHGWEIVAPELAGKKAVTFAAPPKRGDLLKLVVRFTASDENGNPTPLVAGWWVKLDEMVDANQWSGLLRNDVRVPATIQFGSRLWFRPADVIELKRAE